MAVPFAFLPRAVSKHAKAQAPPTTSPAQAAPPAPPTDSASDSGSDHDSSSEWSGIPSPSVDKGKGKAVEQPETSYAHAAKQTTISQDIASLILLALSDYNIWLDGDLRWKLDECLRHAESPDGAGFVPINYLTRRTPFRGSLPAHLIPSETEVVKALRTHANDTLEVRLLVSAPSSSVWYGSGKTSRKKDVGNYEVRRRDWGKLLERASCGWSYARWDDFTVYMECIPAQYRTIGSIARFAQSLLPPPTDPYPIIQNITLPPHYLDKPGDTPKCKGYALVTFSTKTQAETILRDWPWRRRRTSGGSTTRECDTGADADAPQAVKEAIKFGFRTISKARWDKLNEEYLMYKQRLVEEIAHTQSGEPLKHHPGGGEEARDVTEDELGEPGGSEPPVSTVPQTTPSSPYPFNCLVFVRNIHPETNKTTLRALFSRAFQGEASGLDYIDFSKGMDTCYLRLSSPHHTTLLTDYIDEQPKAQAHGLDATGRTPEEGDKPLQTEIIQGKKEELYWDKVPEKVRRQAVDKALKAQAVPHGDSNLPLPPTTQTCATRTHKKRKRERQ